MTLPYSRVLRRTLRDAKVRRLSAPQPNARDLWLHLLYGPHCTAIPGLFVLGEATMADELGWPVEPTRRCFDEILATGMARYDASTRLVWLPNALRHNVPANSNVVVGWRDKWDLLPECALRDEAAAALAAGLAAFGPRYVEAFAIATGTAPPRPSTNPSGKGPEKGRRNRRPNGSVDGPDHAPPWRPREGSADPRGAVSAAVRAGSPPPPVETAAAAAAARDTASGPGANPVDPRGVAAGPNGSVGGPAGGPAKQEQEQEQEQECVSARPRSRETATVAGGLTDHWGVVDLLRRRSRGRIDLTVLGTGDLDFKRALGQLAAQGWSLDDVAAWADCAAAGADSFWDGEYALEALLGFRDGEGNRSYAGLAKCLTESRAWARRVAAAHQARRAAPATPAAPVVPTAPGAFGAAKRALQQPPPRGPEDDDAPRL